MVGGQSFQDQARFLIQVQIDHRASNRVQFVCRKRIPCQIGYALLLIGLRLFNVVFVDRADGRRIISLRKANLREVKRYAET
ncbi:MAG: BrnT family toxin [Pseudomonadota bacterium]|nr:BrnT family toxin [Pseudomonadota bacterium]MDP1903119.1 BrnT family toxin [Pseudomonadota bacterium]MDP2351129.1 BrnT family toxin [Pseudomonadota bacterium]